MTSAPSKPTRPPSSKAVLYCFDCGHESPIEGDWNVQRDGDCEITSCPNCGTTITTRPRSSPRAIDSDGSPCYCTGD